MVDTYSRWLVGTANGFPAAQRRMQASGPRTQVMVQQTTSLPHSAGCGPAARAPR